MTNNTDTNACEVTLRHYFAAMALQGLVSATTDSSYLTPVCMQSLNSKLCQRAIELADEMVRQLEEE